MSDGYIKWDKTYSTNIAVIDEQHQVLINILNELYDVVLDEKKDSKMIDISNELIKYTIYHFKAEEKIFVKNKFPEADEHIKEHKKFVEEIKSINKKRISGDSMSAILELINFLKDWLVEHILVTDKKYVDYFKKNNIVING